MKHLKKNTEKFVAYDKVIQEQLEEGTAEEISDFKTPRKEFYLPNKAVIWEEAESTHGCV